MPNQKYLLNRRRFLATTAAATGAIAMPSILRAQGAPVKLGVLQPVTGALSYSGQQGRLGATLAIEEINAAGGIKGLGQDRSGVRRCAIDAGRRHRRGREDEFGRRRGHRRRLCQHHLPRDDAGRRALRPALRGRRRRRRRDRHAAGLKNTFRFGPGFGVIAKTALDNLVAINDAAGKPAKTVMIVHEDSLFGSGLAKLLNAQLPARLRDARDHRAPDADARLQQRRAQDQGAEPGSRDPRQLLQRIRAARAHHAAAAGEAEGHLLRAERRCVLLQVRQGIPGGREVHHGLQSLVRPAQPEGGRAEEDGRGQGPVLHLRRLHELQLRDAGGRRAASGRLRPIARRSPRRWRHRPSPVTSCPTARPSSSTARTRARRRSTRRCSTTTSR